MSTTIGGIAGYQKGLFEKNKKETEEREKRKGKLTDKSTIYKPERTNMIKQVNSQKKKKK